eukprot:CCRYP_017274-RA/>CCRYP_017274-RA protein AED:0.16 eAED:0.16 QI:294/1/1/1/0.6/0.5/6/744/1136
MAEEQVDYSDYVISRTNDSEVDENSATLPRRNGRTSSLSSVELSSLFEPKEKRLDINPDPDVDDEDSSPSKAGSDNMLYSTEKSKLLDEAVTKQTSRTPTQGRQRRGSGFGSNVLSPAQAKRKVFSPTANVSGSEFSMMGSIPEEGSDEEEDDIVMEVMDYLEDEIDGHTYDELIPLQIRMALEDQIFGWDHFLSSIFGHIAYTVGSYLLAFWIITYIVLREVPWGHYDEATRSNPWHMPHGLFAVIRTAISLFSGVSTFRTIRRRRRVWLRQPYGSSQYLAGAEAERRKSSLQEADQRAKRFVLGSKLWSKLQKSYLKGRDGYLARRVNRKLLKAQKMFERRHKNRVKLIRSTSNSSLLAQSDSEEQGDSTKKRTVASALTRHGHEISHHERVRMLASSGVVRKRIDSIEYTSGEDDAGSIGGSSIGTASYTASDYHSFFPGRIKNGLTLPNFAMESVSHDQMPFAYGEIKNVPYVHGGFFGAAPFMLTNPHWIGILRILMPDVYVEISRRASYAPAPKLIHWAENNPVVAAYGTAHELEFSGRVPTLEWDVFLDPYLVKRVEIVLNEKEAFVQRQKDAREKNKISRQSGDSEEMPADPKDETYAATAGSTPSQPANYSSERLVLKYYDTEIRRRTSILVERMLIAHGNVMQLVLEQTGWLKKYNFSRVKRTRKTLGGGIFAKQWLAIYSEAMKLGLGMDQLDDESESSDSETDESLGSRDDLGGNEDVGGDHSAPTKSIDRANIKDKPVGPPKKIYMKRSSEVENEIEDVDDDMSTDGSTASETSPHKLKRSHKGKRYRRRRKTSRTPKPKRNIVPTSLNQASICPDKTINESILLLKNIMQCSAPLGLLLDMKSRHVSRRVWALVIDFLRDSGARVEGIASFFVEEIRDISQYCSSSVNEIIFFHSAGDMQLSCYKGLVKRGDRVFFNAGSLLWDYPNLYDAIEVRNILMHRLQPCFDGELIKEGYRLKPYAKVTKPNRTNPNSCTDVDSETCDESTICDEDSTTSDLFTKLLLADRHRKSAAESEDFSYEEVSDGICSTIQDYKEHYQLSIGLYVQEFAIDEAAISLIVKYVNSNPHVYDLGLSWGGVNGLTVKGIQPGRFTATDGLWNQRYGGMPWKKDLKPSDTAPLSGD